MQLSDYIHPEWRKRSIPDHIHSFPFRKHIDEVTISGTRMSAVSYIIGISYSVTSEMAGSSHTPTCCLIKLRSNLEAGMKQLRVWLECAYSMAEVLHYPSLSVPLMLLLSPFGDSKMIRSEYENGSKAFLCCIMMSIDFTRFYNKFMHSCLDMVQHLTSIGMSKPSNYIYNIANASF